MGREGVKSEGCEGRRLRSERWEEGEVGGG